MKGRRAVMLERIAFAKTHSIQECAAAWGITAQAVYQFRQRHMNKEIDDSYPVKQRLLDLEHLSIAECSIKWGVTYTVAYKWAKANDSLPKIKRGHKLTVKEIMQQIPVYPEYTRRTRLNLPNDLPHDALICEGDKGEISWVSEEEKQKWLSTH